MADASRSLPQPVGCELTGWAPPARPQREVVAGRYVRLEPLTTNLHAADLFTANTADVADAMWTYLPYGPFTDMGGYMGWMRETCGGDDPFFFAVVDGASGKAVGVAAYLRIDPANGVIEIGHVAFSPALQRTVVATEALYRLIDRVFAAGYRRCEWKCDSLNAPSRAAAERLGFTYEGLFRQAVVVKGRNRDTAWYAIIDRDWPEIRPAFERWLAPENFDDSGRQRTRLAAGRRGVE